LTDACSIIKQTTNLKNKKMENIEKLSAEIAKNIQWHEILGNK